MSERVVMRRHDSGDQGVFGRWWAPGLTLFSGELPERDNRTGESCLLPEGDYPCVWAPSPAFRRYTYRLLETPGRSGILIHSANLMGDRKLGLRAQLLGCISLGEKLGWIEGQKALLISAPAVRRFEESMGRKPFTLEIRRA